MDGKPLAIDLCCGLGGWTEGLLAEGYYVVGFDIEQHIYGEHRYPGQLVIQDILTLHGSQFKNAKALHADPEFAEKNRVAISKARLGWCPKPLQAEYRELVKIIGAKDARESIERRIVKSKPVPMPVRKDPAIDVLDYLREQGVKILILSGNRYSHHGRNVTLKDLAEIANKMREKQHLPLFLTGRAA